MTLTNFTPLASLAGGVMIGLAAAMVLLGCGRIAGISGVFASALTPRKGEDGAWRLLFLGGLVVGGVLLSLFAPGTLGAPVTGSVGRAIAGGLLVGVGVELGAGCTSGHGVCGIGRFSPRSVVATMTFIATGILTVLALHKFGGAS